MGGPVWHASGKGSTVDISRRIALAGVAGVGDPTTDREFEGNNGIFHVQRRLAVRDLDRAGISADLVDVRGTDREREIVDRVYAEAPYLRP